MCAAGDVPASHPLTAVPGWPVCDIVARACQPEHCAVTDQWSDELQTVGLTRSREGAKGNAGGEGTGGASLPDTLSQPCPGRPWCDFVARAFQSELRFVLSLRAESFQGFDLWLVHRPLCQDSGSSISSIRSPQRTHLIKERLGFSCKTLVFPGFSAFLANCLRAPARPCTWCVVWCAASDRGESSGESPESSSNPRFPEENRWFCSRRGRIRAICVIL